jgi:glycosyltransferase involved in cell wall biosynthesis
MKVLHLDSGINWRGGQQQVFYLASGLEKLGVEQHVVFREGSKLAARIQSLKLPLSTLPFSSEFSLASLYRLVKIRRQFNPDIIHAHDSRTLGLVAILKAMGERVKLVAARRVPFHIRRNPFWKFKYQRQTDKIIAVSKFILELLIEEGVQREKIQLVYDGFPFDSLRVQSDRSASRRRYGVAEDELLVGTIGQFSPEKGHEFLIRGFKKVWEIHSHARLIIVGGGALRESYRRLIDELQLHEQVILPGFVPDLGEVFSALDLFVFPSLEEGLGSTLLMAMAHQVPICASRTGGIPELVVEGQTGFLFPPGDAQSLADTVLHALESPQIAQSLSGNGFRLVEAQFPVERMVSGTYDVYSNVLRT